MLKNTGATSAIAGDVVGHDSEAMPRICTKIDVETKYIFKKNVYLILQFFITPRYI